MTQSREEPPSMDDRPRPPPPLQLAALLRAKGDLPAVPPCDLVAPGLALLRKVTPKPIFEAFDDDKVYNVRPPTQMMRLIDSLRYHKPTAEEREELNLCSSTERLYLHALGDLLLACGGRKGFRFLSADINRLREASEEISRRYAIVDRTFQALPLDVTQFKFPPELRRLEDEPTMHFDDGHAVVSPELPVQMDPTTADATQWRAMHFQWLARRYMESFAELRATALEIRRRFRVFLASQDASAVMEIRPEPGERRASRSNSENDLIDHACALPVEAEFEAKAHHPFPRFLHVLIQKYHREQRRQDSAWSPSCPEPPVDSIGIFAVYLAHCLMTGSPLTQVELHAFEVLLQILKLQYTIDSSQMRIHEVTYAFDPSPAASALQWVTQATLCAMIYEFLATVRELRLVSRQRDLLPTCERARRRRSRQQSMSRTLSL